MWWMNDIIVPAVLILGVCVFVLLVRTLTRRAGRRTYRTAESLYNNGKLDAVPASLTSYELDLCDDGRMLVYDYDTQGERTGITSLLGDLRTAGIRFSDLDTSESSLEDIFVSLVHTP